MRFGTKLPIDLFTCEPCEASQILLDEFGGIEELLSYLGQKVDAVELSTIGSKSDPLVFQNAVSCCNRHGLEVTVHGLLKEAESANEFFVPYLPVFALDCQEYYNITLHPLKEKEDTLQALKELCAYADKMVYPVTFTLENQRLTNEKSVNGICKSVGEIVAAVNHPRLRTCLDFGHYLSNKRKQGEDADPQDEIFADRIGHTHIHSMYQGTTHFPLFCGETEWDENLSLLLGRNYDGIYSLELDYNRFAGTFGLKESLCRSIEILKNACMQAERKESERLRYQNEYPDILKKITAQLNNLSQGVALLSPSSYLLKLGDVRIAIDPSLTDISIPRKGREVFLQMIQACDCVIYTHKHGDHYDSTVAAEINHAENLWLIPDFFSQNDIRGGRLEEKNCIFVEAEKTYKVGDAEIKFFESCHSSNENLIPEYGFAVLYKGKHYVFPVDVRNYDPTLATPFPDTERVFAHLWLGREMALEPNAEYIRQFTEYVNIYGAKSVCLGHLFDVRREVRDMWTDLHCFGMEKKINNLIPLRMGDVIALP